MSERAPSLNALLEAIRTAAPNPPPAEWMTLHEIILALKISKNQAHRRMQILQEQGKVQKMRGPRRTDGCGSATYYMLNGKGSK